MGLRLRRYKMKMEDIINAARKENWEYVDSRIPRICDDPKVQKKAAELLSDDDGNIRDLGASILGRAHNIPVKIKPILFNIMKNDSNPYARYRSAFALAGHNPGRYKKKVVTVLKEASCDKDVGDIAKEYLEMLKKS
jgi:HEAT repeat protein